MWTAFTVNSAKSKLPAIHLGFEMNSIRLNSCFEPSWDCSHERPCYNARVLLKAQRFRSLPWEPQTLEAFHDAHIARQKNHACRTLVSGCRIRRKYLLRVRHEIYGRGQK